MQYHTMPGGRRIAFRKLAGNAPTLMFLTGYMSDMAGGKAGAVMEWARRNGRACLLLDYSGCGASDGDFAKGTLTRWREEVGSLVGAQVNGRVVLIGSSMGGWLMLLVARLLGRQVAAMIGVAAAPDFTDWGYDAAQKAALASGQAVFEDNPYGPDLTPTHPAFWADGESAQGSDRPDRADLPGAAACTVNRTMTCHGTSHSLSPARSIQTTCR